MAQQRKSTPEEQLLKLIENPDADPKSAGRASASSKAPSKSRVSFGKLQGILSYLKTSFAKQKGTGAGALSGAALVTRNIRWVNRALGGLILVTVIYLGLDLIFLKPSRADFLTQVGASDPIYPILNKDTGLTQQEFNYYDEAVKKRNPFFPPSVKPAADTKTAVAMVAPSSSKITQALQGLKLVGVSLGGKDPVAMIEDESTGRTYFLRYGQEIRGIKIQSVRREKVTVTYEGEEGELF